MKTPTVRAALCASAAIVLAGCGSSSSSQAAPATTPAAATVAATSTAAAIGAKVSANTASQEELTAAFTAAGISSADRWAREVTEYRPYPTDDPTFAALRSELAKYNPSPEVVDQIVATLTP
jgi:hypothetical protein